MNKKLWVILETIMLLIWIITLIIFLVQIKTKGVECIVNPLKYGSKVLGEQNNATFDCNCKFSNEPDFIVYFNSTFYTIKPIEDLLNLKINLTYESPNLTLIFDKNMEGGK